MMSTAAISQIILIIAFFLGIIATLMTFINFRKLKGEIFEMPFLFFGLGILMFSLSLAEHIFINGLMDSAVVDLIQGILIIFGFIFLIIASTQITRDIRAMESFVSKLKKK